MRGRQHWPAASTLATPDLMYLYPIFSVAVAPTELRFHIGIVWGLPFLLACKWSVYLAFLWISRWFWKKVVFSRKNDILNAHAAEIGRRIFGWNYELIAPIWRLFFDRNNYEGLKRTQFEILLMANVDTVILGVRQKKITLANGPILAADVQPKCTHRNIPVLLDSLGRRCASKIKFSHQNYQKKFRKQEK